MRNSKHSEEQAEVVKFSHDGRGIARINGKTTFIQGALPEETVSFHYIKRKRDFDEGVLTTVQKPSPYRVEPKCIHFSNCGGCSLQHLDTQQQIHEKQALFIDMLSRIGHCAPESILPPLSGPAWHYRNKARLSVRYDPKMSLVRIGFRERNNPRYINNITQCQILHPLVNTHFNALQKLISTFDNLDMIAQIEVAAGDVEVALIFRNLSPLSPNDEKKLITFAQTSGFKIFLQPGSMESVSLFYPKDSSDFITYQLPNEGITFQFHPTDFTQINAELNRLMIPYALELLALKPEDSVMDLFCGLGNFSLPIAKHCAHVVGVEGSERMVERAKFNANLNQIKNVDFFSANLEDVALVEEIAQHSVNKLLIDPPRLGAYEIVKRIELLNPERIVYVSCNPATLARDAGVLVNEKGYRMSKAGVMDMFPHTAHVESIALFER